MICIFCERDLPPGVIAEVCWRCLRLTYPMNQIVVPLSEQQKPSTVMASDVIRPDLVAA
jgi:hypothetical protein